MSSCHSQNELEEEMTESELGVKRDREHYLRQEMRGTIRAVLLPLALSSGDLFAPIDVAVGLDRRKLLLEELDEFRKLLELKLEDVYGHDQEGDRSSVCDDPECAEGG